MSLQNKIKERIGASPKETPKLPEIKNKDARKAQADLNRPIFWILWLVERP